MLIFVDAGGVRINIHIVSCFVVVVAIRSITSEDATVVIV
jgi:hypothetical protein